MTDLIATLFVHPMTLARWQQVLLLLPLCLCVSLVYKTIKCEDLREVAAATFKNWITIVVGMYIVGIALYLVFEVTTRAF